MPLRLAMHTVSVSGAVDRTSKGRSARPTAFWPYELALPLSCCAASAHLFMPRHLESRRTLEQGPAPCWRRVPPAGAGCPPCPGPSCPSCSTPLHAAAAVDMGLTIGPGVLLGPCRMPAVCSRVTGGIGVLRMHQASSSHIPMRTAHNVALWVSAEATTWVRPNGQRPFF